MSWLHHQHSRRKALTTAAGLIVGAAVPVTSGSHAAASPDSGAGAPRPATFSCSTVGTDFTRFELATP
ncbi:hypothetical protein ABZ553_04890 [Streptomyces sparsogenes]|uniref:hypothetical protein n=1 Tax=Streptomyces sparsogenes TaxID=67365 RepID=UPI0033CBE6B6